MGNMLPQHRKGNMKVVMAGLRASGKSTVMGSLDASPPATSIPLAGSRGLVECSGVQFMLRETLASLRCDFDGTDALIYVVDSSDYTSVSRARDDLQKIASDDALRGASLLVMANKQDVPAALSPDDLAGRLDLEALPLRVWRMQGTCASTGDGLREGLNWLAASRRLA